MSRQLAISLPRSQVMERRRCSGSSRHRLDHRGGHRVRRCGRGQVQQHREPGAALDQGADRTVVRPDDQVAFPMAGHGPIRGFGGPVADSEFLTRINPAAGVAIAGPACCPGVFPVNESNQF